MKDGYIDDRIKELEKLKGDTQEYLGKLRQELEIKSGEFLGIQHRIAELMKVKEDLSPTKEPDSKVDKKKDKPKG